MKDDQILDSWKEISEYLDRSRKTCFRWEKEFGLPIHRLDGTPKARVFAYRDELDRWLEETLKGKESPQKLFPSFFIKFTSSAKSKKSIIPALIVALAIISAAVWKFFLREESITAPKIENSIAIISFENLTGDSNNDIYQKSIPSLLITNLENTGYFYVATWERLRDLLKQMGESEEDFIDSDLGFELCRREGIRALVLGSLNKAGDMFVTDVKVYDVETKKSIKSVSSKGLGEQSILETQIDELSKEISQGMGISMQKIEAAQLNIREVTTNSIEAYKYFLKGREDWEKQYWHEGKESLEKAVILDPQFAMAYLYLGRCLEVREAKNEAYEKARTYSKKATEKERLYIEAAYVGAIEDNLDKRFNILEEIARKYPREKRAHYELGLHYRNDKVNFVKALEKFNRVLELDPDFGLALNLIAYTYFEMENYEKAIEYFEKYITVSPGEANPIDSMAEAFFQLGNLEEAVAKFKEALEIKPDWAVSYRALSYIHALNENYSEAIKLADDLIANSQYFGDKRRGHLFKGFYYLWLGRMRQSLEEIRTASVLADSEGDYDGKEIAGLMEGFVNDEIGKHELTRESLEDWFEYMRKNFTPTRYKLVENIWLGRSDLREGRIDSAKVRLAKIKSILPDASLFSRKYYKPLHDSLYIEVLLAEGSLEDAVSFVKRLECGLNPKNIYQIASYHAYISKDILARIYLKKGELDKAIAEYERLMTFDPKSKDRLLINPLYHYRLAILYEQKGWEGKAIDEYKKFLALWKDADPGRAEVEDARIRLTRLE